MPPPARARRQRGVTLVELLVTVAVFGILLGLGVPAVKQLLAAQRMRSASYDLVSDLVLARSEALKRGGTVTLTPAASGWTGGWTVRSTAGDGALIAQRGAVGGVTITGAPDSISFDLNGRVADTVRIGLSDGSRHRCISLDTTGRPRSQPMECP